MKSDSDEGGFFHNNNNPTSDNPHPKTDYLISDELCESCTKNEIDHELKNIFDLKICKACKREKLKFITKTTCKEEYLLDDYDLKTLKFLIRPNPHKGTWTNMNLYLQNEVITVSLKKHTSLENIEKIKKEKNEKWLEKKRKKITKTVREYRRKTLLEQVKDNKRHVHEFVVNGKMKKCSCGLEFEEEEI